MIFVGTNDRPSRIHTHMASLHGIASIILTFQPSNGLPTTHIVPLERSLHDHYIPGMFHHSIVDRLALNRCELLFQRRLILPSTRRFRNPLQMIHHLGLVLRQFVHDRVGLPNEDARIPVKVSRLVVPLSHVSFGFFPKLLDGKRGQGCVVYRSTPFDISK